MISNSVVNSELIIVQPQENKDRGMDKSKMEVLAVIPARGNSKSIPRKNVKELAGFPLITYSIAAALQSRRVTRVIVSTDDEEIAEIARQFGAQVPFMRPDEFAQDQTPDQIGRASCRERV